MPGLRACTYVLLRQLLNEDNGHQNEGINLRMREMLDLGSMEPIIGEERRDCQDDNVGMLLRMPLQ